MLVGLRRTMSESGSSGDSESKMEEGARSPSLEVGLGVGAARLRNSEFEGSRMVVGWGFLRPKKRSRIVRLVVRGRVREGRKHG